MTLKPRPIEAVLFDMGGVLLDFQGDPGVPTGRRDFRGRAALLHYLNERGAGLDLDDLERDLFGPWRRDSERRQALGREADWTPHLRRLRKRAGLRTPTRTLLQLWFRPLAEQVVPLPGAVDAVAAAAGAGKRLAIVSNVPMPGALYVPLLERYGLARFFAKMYFSYDEGHRKPSPALIRRALTDLAVSPLDAVIIGDRRSVDVVAGKSAGLRTIWLRSDDGGGPSPDETIDELSSLPTLL